MSDGICFCLDLHVPEGALHAWRAEGLLAQRERLVGTKGFAAIDMGDDDLLGCTVTVRGETTLEGALNRVRSFVSPERVVRWTQIIDEGQEAVRMEEKGDLPRDAVVADLLAHLRLDAEQGRQFVEIEGEGGELRLRGVLADYDDYRTYRMAMIYAATAVGAHGGQSRVTFLGQSDGEYVVLFVDTEGATVTITETDPQNLDEEDWDERLHDVSALEAAHAGWRKKQRKKKRRGKG